MSSNNEENDKAKNSTGHLDRVDYGYVFRLTGKLYQPADQKAETQSREKFTSETNQIPIIVTVNDSTNWVDRLVASLAVVISIVTVILLYFTVQYARKQWFEANRTAEAAICAAGTSQNQLIASQRPWVAFDMTQGNKLGIETHEKDPNILRFTTLGDGRTAKIGLSYWLQNFGHTPAAVRVYGEIVETPPGNDLVEWQLRESSKICEDGVAQFDKTPSSWVVLPNSPMIYAVIYDGSVGENHMEPIKIHSRPGPKNKFVHELTNIGCVVYREMGSESKFHQTPFTAAVLVRHRRGNLRYAVANSLLVIGKAN